MARDVASVIDTTITQWLLSGDVSIQYQAHRDLLNSEKRLLRDLQSRIETEGWGVRFMSRRQKTGHWGKGLYQPKWTSTHYTLLDLRNLCFPPGNTDIEESLSLVLGAPKGKDGGLNLGKTVSHSDICVNGMILNYATWFLGNDRRLRAVVEFLLDRQMQDGGWNCEYYNGARHSSLHSTISVLEGLLEWIQSGDTELSNEIANAIQDGEEFILSHQLYKSRKDGSVIDPNMLRLAYPSRWRFDILRALDYFQKAGKAYDRRMQDALDLLLSKRRADGKWPVYAHHTGGVHFDMETVGQASRWNTLRALRVFNHFNMEV